MPEQRPNHLREANIQANQAADFQVFDEATFGAYLDNSQLKFDKGGALVVTFRIPPPCVPDALNLRYLCTNPLPLTIHLTVADSFEQVVKEQEARRLARMAKAAAS